jgi:murein DD-endopeptidase MepM/ murein hydrolase activator NlpD
MEMAKKSDVYTIFVLPDPTSKPYSFSIKKKTCHYILGILGIGIFVFTGFFAQSLSLLGDVTELNLLRHETKGHRVKIQSVVQSVDDLKKEMARLGDLDQKLRIMTDLPPRKGGVNLLAQGGWEEPLAASLMEDGTSFKKNDIPRLTDSIYREVQFLRKVAKEEEKSFNELIRTISETKSRWASTPSIWPVQEGWVTSNYGKRVSPFTGNLMMHNGLDIAVERGAPILSPAVGRVVRVETDALMGRMVVIDHGHGKETYFGHMEKHLVKIGQEVTRGEVIGLVGSTGRSTGPHVHYEVRVNGDPVDPTRYILN